MTRTKDPYDEEPYEGPPYDGNYISLVNNNAKKMIFKKEPKDKKLKKILGDNLLSMTMSGDKLELHLRDDNLSQSDLDKIQKIVDGE